VFSEYDSYRRRADENQRWASECKIKVRSKPQSADTYRRMHDEALAEMYFNDAMARAHSGNGSTEHSEARDLKAANAKGLGSGAYDAQTFRTYLNMMLDNLLDKPVAPTL
jgi:hypothetical protein